MPKTKKCTSCQKIFPKGKISRWGLCEDCGWARYKESVDSIRRKEGPDYEKWKQGLLRALERKS